MNIKSTGFGVYIEKEVSQQNGFKANATITFKVNPSDGNYISFNGLKFFFKNSPANPTDVKIGASISETIDNLLSNPNLPKEVTFKKVDNDKIYIEYNEIGTKGNSWTISSDFMSVPNTLSGGSDNPDPDWQEVKDTTINYLPEELEILTGTTKSTLIVKKALKEKDDLIVVDEKNNLSEIEINGDNLVEVKDTINKLDILGDGSCLATFTFDGSVIDLSGKYKGVWKDNNGNDIKGIYEKGKFEQAGRFNGNNVVEVDLGFKLTCPFSISGWIKKEKFGTGEEVILGWDYNGQPSNKEFDYWIKSYDGGKNWLLNVGANGKETSTQTITIPENKWVFYYAEFTNNQIRLKMIDEDGKVLGNVTASADITNSLSTKIAFGAWVWDVNKSGFCYILNNSLLDQIRIFNKALNDTELQKVYNEEYQSTIDISNLKLANLPKKAFFNRKPQVVIALEKEKQDLLPYITEKKIPIITGTTNNVIVTPEDIFESEEIIIEGKDFKVSGVEKIDTTQILDIFGDNSCIATYTFDGNSNDLSGKFNGVWKDKNGNVIQGSYDTGKFGQAGKFDGNSFIETKLALKLGYTISFWTNKNGVCISALNASDNGNDFNISRNGFNGGFCDAHIDYKFTDDFYHIVVIIPESGDINDLKFYVNGEEQKIIVTNTRYKMNTKSDSYLVFGKDVFHNSYFIGNLDQVRIFNRELNQDEINHIYREVKRKFDISSLALKSTPKVVIRKGVIPLTKETSSLTQFVGTDYRDINIKTGLKVLTDLGELEVKEAKKEFINVVNKLDILGDNSCIATFTFDGNSNDLSGKFNGVWKDKNGNVIKGAYEVGKFGQAAKFDGNSYITIGDGNFLKIGTNPYSFSFWFKFNSIINGENGFLGKYDGQDGSFTLEYLGNKNQFVGYSNSSTQIAFSNSLEEPLLPGVWYHIVFIFEQNNYRCYLNGKLLPVTQTGKNFNVTNNVIPVIGTYKAGNEIIDGLIDQVRIFNRVLRPEEIQTLYKKEQFYKYTITFDQQKVAPQTCAIPQNTISTPIIETKFDGEKFVSKFDSFKKDGRVLQRRIILPEKDIEVIPPFTSQLYKG